jgi:ribosomal protein S18 acetylase RimI-like enzyme
MALLTFESATTPEQIARMSALAGRIWREYWPERIGAKQTEYMLEMMQSPEAIARSIAEEGYLWLFALDASGQVVGYTAAAPEHFRGDPDDPAPAYGDGTHGAAINRLAPDRLFISKIYLKQGERGKHYSTAIMDYWCAYAATHGLAAVYLTVNKDNQLGIRAYKAQGLETIESRRFAIGAGNIMDDYVMAKMVDSMR